MTSRVKKLYKEAVKNKEFLTEYERVEPDFIKPRRLFMPNEIKIIYACIYQGWKIAHGTYNDKDY